MIRRHVVSFRREALRSLARWAPAQADPDVKSVIHNAAGMRYRGVPISHLPAISPSPKTRAIINDNELANQQAIFGFL
jgi:hypothetical protein